jgi:large subunit ribosomal protein L17
MFRNMVTSLLKHDRIQTTGAKAKELRRWADHIITLAKRGDLHARRQALAIVREKDVVHALFENAVERFGNVSGGYTRVVKLGRRPGDAAPISLVELVVSQDTKGKKTKKKKTKGKAAPQKAAAAKKTTKKEEEKPADTAKTEGADTQDQPAVKGKKSAKPKAAPKKKTAAKKEEKAAGTKAPAKKKAAAGDKTKSAPAEKKAASEAEEKK